VSFVKPEIPIEGRGLSDAGECAVADAQRERPGDILLGKIKSALGAKGNK